MAVILLYFGLRGLFKNPQPAQQINQPVVSNENPDFERNPLTGLKWDHSFFTIAIMFDNSYTVRPQYGISQADIVYEALAEGNITRLMGIFDSSKSIEKIGPVRSARPYFMDWAGEYGGIYMHVGGSPEALSTISKYDFVNIDQIGANEIYFWRDKNLDAPHNVFTSSSNWLRVGEIKDITDIDRGPYFTYVDFPDDYPKERPYLPPASFVVDFSSEDYKVDWKFNEALNVYQRWQGDQKHMDENGNQLSAQNIIVQVAKSKIIDDKERRNMENKTGGKAYLVNPYSYQEGIWKYEDGHTSFYKDDGSPMELLAGNTWIEVVPSEDSFILEQ